MLTFGDFVSLYPIPESPILVIIIPRIQISVPGMSTSTLSLNDDRQISIWLLDLYKDRGLSGDFQRAQVAGSRQDGPTVRKPRVLDLENGATSCGLDPFLPGYYIESSPLKALIRNINLPT